MTGFGLRKNMVFDWSGSKFRIDRLHENGDVVLERLADGSISVLKRQALLMEYREGKIAAVSEREASATSAVKIFSRPLDELSEVVQLEVTRRHHYLQALCDAGSVVFTKAHIEPLIQRVAAEIDDPKHLSLAPSLSQREGLARIDP